MRFPLAKEQTKNTDLGEQIQTQMLASLMETKAFTGPETLALV